MKILKQTRKRTVVELSPVEMELLRGAITKESTLRKKTWKFSNPKFPEELLYHLVMKEESEQLKLSIYRAIKKYREWGILQ
jgi:hypothetical protein